MNDNITFLDRLRFLFGRPLPTKEELTISSQVDDSSGWVSTSGHDYDPSKIQEIYQDALQAWRKNPIAWRIIAITTDYVVGDHISISSSNRQLNKFISTFWDHPKNLLDNKLHLVCDELSRAGDVFIVLTRNQYDGMSYIRFVTKDKILKIITAENDYETELSYIEQLPNGQTKEWYSPFHPSAETSQSIVLHYSINRPLGALFGESDLTTMIPWLQRYSRMLEDRVRLHWAVRAFLWIVTVPSAKIKEKVEQYRTPPEAGSIIVKDVGEEWNVITPTLRGSDASYDLRAVRGMIDAGSSYPPHWRGESGDANLATATAMQGPTERHLLRRQKYFVWMIEDIIFYAYQRYLNIRNRTISSQDYQSLFNVSMPDISRSDNESLARSSRDFSTGLLNLFNQMPGNSETFNKLALSLFFKFAAEPQSQDTIDQIFSEIKSNPRDIYGNEETTSTIGEIEID